MTHTIIIACNKCIGLLDCLGDNKATGDILTTKNGTKLITIFYLAVVTFFLSLKKSLNWLSWATYV